MTSTQNRSTLSPKQASDHTGQSWLTCFGEAGEVLFDGIKAPELKRLEIEEPKAYEKITQVQRGVWVVSLQVPSLANAP